MARAAKTANINIRIDPKQKQMPSSFFRNLELRLQMQ